MLAVGRRDVNGGISMTVTQDELDDGLIDIARRNYADWFARKHIGDELYAACP
jgi:hypothetical protein